MASRATCTPRTFHRQTLRPATRRSRGAQRDRPRNRLPHDRPYSTEVGEPDEALIARYAWGDDYHDVITARLDALIAWMRTRDDSPFEARRYVDTGPVQERVVAQHAGLGWR